jgi:hypothetical protein
LSPTGRYDTTDGGKKTGHTRHCAGGPVIADAANAAIVCVAANAAINAGSERGDQFLAVCFSIS